ncbi:MAG: NAD(P)H-dependent oxidoreductase [Saprospiraceae bacterium]
MPKHLVPGNVIVAPYSSTMITIIQATNRADSNTEFISRQVHDFLKTIYSAEINYVGMQDLPSEILHIDPYQEKGMPEKLKLIQDHSMIPAEKFIWISPEYNGSYPGVVKLFIDAISVRKCDETFAFKKSLLIGVTSGRSGNLRGLDHLSSILVHMKSIIYPRLLPISRVHELMDDKHSIVHDPTVKVLQDHLIGFVDF